jgi:hypothetical protein
MREVIGVNDTREAVDTHYPMPTRRFEWAHLSDIGAMARLRWDMLLELTRDWFGWSLQAQVCQAILKQGGLEGGRQKMESACGLAVVL